MALAPVQPSILHLHGFKCAGTTFTWSLERAFQGAVVYLESPEPGDRLDWRHARDYLEALDAPPGAVTSHLLTLPPPGACAALKVCFLREPLARLISAFRFQVEVQRSLEPMPIRTFLQSRLSGVLSNYQTRHLSPQEPVDWLTRKGWGLRPELIDLHRHDLFVGLVERYDESIIALEYQLQQMGLDVDLAYPERLNTTDAKAKAWESDPELAASPVALTMTELDLTLYRRAEQRLDERLAIIPDLEGKLHHFSERRLMLREKPAAVALKPNSEWVHLPLPVI